MRGRGRGVVGEVDQASAGNCVFVVPVGCGRLRFGELAVEPGDAQLVGSAFLVLAGVVLRRLVVVQFAAQPVYVQLVAA